MKIDDLKDSGTAPFSLEGGWNTVKDMEDVVIQLNGNRDVKPHLFSKHGG